MCTCTGSRSTIALARNAPGNATHADQQRDRDHLGVDRAEHAEHADLDDADRHRDRRIGRDHGGALQAGRHQHREQDDAGAAGAADHRRPSRTTRPRARCRSSVRPRASRSRRSGTLSVIMLPITSMAPRAGEQRVAPGAEHRGRQRAETMISAAAPVDHLAERERAARIGEQRRDRDDRHHRLGADDRHQHQRHQRAGAVARDAADDRGERSPSRRSARAASSDMSAKAASTVVQQAGVTEVRLAAAIRRQIRRRDQHAELPAPDDHALDSSSGRRRPEWRSAGCP